MQKAILEHPVYVELQHDAEIPPSGDPYIAAFSEALMLRLTQNQPFSEWYFSLIASKQANEPFVASHATAMTRYLLQDYVLAQTTLPEDNQRQALPTDFHDVAKWVDVIDEIYNTPVAREHFMTDMLLLPNQKTIPERSASNVVVAATKQQELALSQPIRILDFGSGRNLPLAWLHTALQQTERHFLRRPLPEGYSHHEEVLLAAIGKMSFAGLGESYGIDAWPKIDARMDRWQKACQNPQTMQDPNVQQQEHYLEKVLQQSPHIHFCAADFAQPSLRYVPLPTKHEKWGEALPLGYTAHQVNMSQVVYQLPPEKRRRAIENGQNWLAEGGLLVVSEFATLDLTKDHPADQLQFLEHWRAAPYQHTTFILPKGGDHFMPVIHWLDGTCKTMQSSQSKLAAA